MTGWQLSGWQLSGCDVVILGTDPVRPLILRPIVGSVPKNDLAARVGSSYLAVDGVEKFCYNTFEKFGE